MVILLCYFLFRYVIVKHVRKDHLDDLPVPNKIKLYLNTPFYYSEQVPTCRDIYFSKNLKGGNLAVS